MNDSPRASASGTVPDPLGSTTDKPAAAARKFREAGLGVIANLSIWFLVFVGSFGILAVLSAATSKPIPKFAYSIFRLLDPQLVALQVFAGFMCLCILALASRFNVRWVNDLGRSIAKELASIATNFGSIFTLGGVLYRILKTADPVAVAKAVDVKLGHVSILVGLSYLLVGFLSSAKLAVKDPTCQSDDKSKDEGDSAHRQITPE
jgi:hypothetical protein